MRSRSIAIICLVGSLGTGGGVAAATPATPATHTITAPTGSNQTIRLQVGDRLKIHLGAAYRRPTSTERGVIHRINHSGGYPTGERARATFKALAAGRADVTSTTDAPCLHATPRCEIAQQLWVVHVVVKRH